MCDKNTLAKWQHRHARRVCKHGNPPTLTLPASVIRTYSKEHQ